MRRQKPHQALHDSHVGAVAQKAPLSLHTHQPGMMQLLEVKRQCVGLHIQCQGQLSWLQAFGARAHNGPEHAQS